MKKPRVKICLPYYDNYAVARMGFNSLHSGLSFDYEIEKAQGYDPAEGRNALITASMKIKQTDFGPFDYHYFNDSDVCTFGADIEKLIALDKGIVSAAYSRRDDPESYQAGSWDPETPGSIANYVLRKSKGHHPVDYVGGGGLLVKTPIFSKLEYPYFRRELIRKGDEQGECGEDYGFCLQAKRAGVEVYVDCDTVLYHDTGCG